MFSKYCNLSKPLGRGPINSPRPGLQHTPAPRGGGMTLRIGLRVNQTPLTQNHSFFVSVTWTTLSSLLVGGVMPSPRASLFRAVYVVYGFRAVFQMSLPPSSSYRLPAGSWRKVWEDAMQEQDNEALTSGRNTTNLKSMRRQIASVFTSQHY